MEEGHLFTADEIASVKNQFPRLEYVRQGVWEGMLDFDKTYGDCRIRDSYQISIFVPKGYPFSSPSIKELDGRVQEVADRHGITDKRSIHWTKFGPCLHVPQERVKKVAEGNMSIAQFIDSEVTNYFYGLSFFDEHGRWPWREYAHLFGPLEYHAEDDSIQTEKNVRTIVRILGKQPGWREYRKQLIKPNPNRACLCGSEKPISTCHDIAWKGMLRLGQDLRNFKLDIYKLFPKPKKEAKKPVS